MKITWIGHACFKIESDGFALILDPYEDGYVPGLKPLRESANMVLCSHEHGDHNAKDLRMWEGAIPIRLSRRSGPGLSMPGTSRRWKSSFCGWRAR